MTYLAAALFFTLVLLASLVALHLTVRFYWHDIARALRGELGRPVRTAPSPFAPRRRAAF